MKALLIGDWRGDWLAYNFPLLPWLGLYLIAAAVGRLFAQLEDRGERQRVRRGAVVLGLSGISLAMLLKLVVHGLVRWLLAGQRRSAQPLGSIREKLPRRRDTSSSMAVSRC